MLGYLGLGLQEELLEAARPCESSRERRMKRWTNVSDVYSDGVCWAKEENESTVARECVQRIAYE